ncbi:MAG: acyl-CoA thioesterase [Myxococcota bacterium]
MSDARTDEPATPAASAVEMNEILLPSHANALGTAFGGTIMAWVDVCAAMAAQRHARRVVVTASMDAVSFLAPIKVGQVVTLKGQVNYAGRTSMEVGVRVEAEDPLTADRVHAMSAYLTFVALDADGAPVEVRPLRLETARDRLRHAEAEARRAARLELARHREDLADQHRDEEG